MTPARTGRSITAPLRRRVLDGARIVLTLAFGLIGSYLIYRVIDANAHLQQRDRIGAAGQAVIGSFDIELTRTVEAVRGLSLMIASQSDLRHEEFLEYSKRVMANSPSLRFLEWQPVVAAVSLADFEAKAKALGLKNFRVTEPDAGRFIPVRPRGEYVPILFAWPRESGAIGVDMGFDPARMRSKLKARDSGQPIASETFKIISSGIEALEANAFAISAPVYSPGPTGSVAERRKQLMGYVAGVIQVPDILRDAAFRANAAQLDLLVFDRAGETPQLIYAARGDSALPAASDSDYQVTEQDLVLTLEVGARPWEIVLHPRADFFSVTRNDASIALLAGITATLLLTLSLFWLQRSRRQIEAAEETLSVERQHLSNILEGTNAGTWEWNVHTGVLQINDRWAEMLGYTLAELEPVSVQTWLDLTHADDCALARDLLERHFSGELDYFDYEFRMRHKDGSWVWVSSRGSLSSRTAKGEPEWMAGTHLEITERKQAEEALRDAKRLAEDANMAKSRFLATMSHEIRTPMNGILGMAQLLSGPDNDEQERREFVKIILDSGRTLLTLLNDILDLSKIEAGALELRTAVFSPALVVREIASLMTGSIAEKGLTLSAHWHDGDACYMGDPMRIRQMLTNLVSNAIKFTYKGHIRIDACELDRHDGVALLEVSVTDTGIGIAEEHRVLLFKPFSQVDSSNTRRFGGTGLGLSIVRNLAERMNGSVGVDSEADHGSRFWFRIQVGISDATQKESIAFNVSEIATRERDTPPSTPAAHILIVEDHPTNTLVLESLLQTHGYTYQSVSNGAQAVAIITSGEHFDLVLMDCQMPVMGGLEATRLIRQHETFSQKRIPIIAITADAFAEDETRCMEAGMDGFIVKPVDVTELTTTLEKWLARRGSHNNSDDDNKAANPAWRLGSV